MADEDRIEPEVLVSVPTEPEAAIIVAALDEQGIAAEATGGYTATFATAVPGEVQVLVHRADLERAQAILAELHREGAALEAESESQLEGESDSEPEP